MPKTNILFLGSSKNSLIVKKALIKANYKIVDSKPDLIIVADYGQVIPKKSLNQAEKGNLNIHPSLLPKYRGATPVPRTLLNKETKTGVTIIEMVDKIDAGPIVAQKTLTIKPSHTSETLLIDCFTLGAKLLIKTLPNYLSNKITLKPQPADSPTPYCHRFKKTDGFISWKQFAKSIKNNFKDIDHKIRAFYPWPGVYTRMPASPAGRTNQKILKLLPENQLQLEGKQPISLKQFLSGYSHLL